MKAVQLIGYGDPVDNVELHDVAEPSPPGTGEVLVGMEYAPINFNDLMIVRGEFSWRPQLPATIGNEGAGVVLALGAGVASVAVGDRVAVLSSATARTYQQRLVAPADEVVVVPRDADPQQAAMMAINPVSAALLLDEYVDLKAGDAVAFNSATSGMSQWLIALAKERGLRTIGLVRRASDVETVTRRGCDIVVVDDEPDDAITEKLRGLNVRLGLDVLGGASAGQVFRILSEHGRLVVYGSVTGEPLQLAGSLFIQKDLTVAGFYESSPRMRPKINTTLRNLVGYLGTDGIEQPVSAVYTLDRLKDAVAHAETGKKVLLQLDGTAQAG